MDAPDPSPGPGPGPPRARGAASLSARADGGRSRLSGLRQEGSLRVLFPRPGGDALEAVLLNTAGGLTGGDRLSLRAEAGAGAGLVLATQACERAYRAAGGEARVETELRVEPGGRLDWLPQETILFEGSRLRRRLRLDLAPGGAALLVEPLLFGRLARGERLHDAALHDRWEVRREGRVVFADALALSGDVHALLDRPGVAGGARAMATVLLAGPGAGGRLRALRDLAGGAASLVGDDLLLARVLAPNGFDLRARLLPIILALAGGVPKVWNL